MAETDLAHRFYSRYVELLGGADKARAAEEAEEAERQRRWSQDVDTIGRILRAHLYVEHYMSIHLQSANAQLGPLHDAKLGFAQKTHLLDRRGLIGNLIPGIKQLNTVRNRLAHRLSAVITRDDRRIFLQDGWLEARSPVAIDELTDVEVLEQFAYHAAAALHEVASPVKRAMFQAYEEIYREDELSKRKSECYPEGRRPAARLGE